MINSFKPKFIISYPLLFYFALANNSKENDWAPKLENF